jgi:D-alanyl-D-alanine carboxypeptidase (penicillin-binding protein 5/6)
LKRFLCFLLLFSTIFTVRAHAEGPAAGPAGVSAPSALLMEKRTGEVLCEKDSHRHYAPASVTKIMTMLLIAEDIEAGKLKPEDIVTASARAASFGGSCVYLAEGEQMSVDEMLKCIAVVSANDCAVAMAEHISGSEAVFVERMNRRAGELGMEDTHFTNCTGLFDDSNHYSSAYDVALMSRELLRHEFIKDYTTIWMDSIRGGEFGLSSTNRLVYSYPGCTGLKTGYTDKAKYCISATAERDGVEYIAVVMHSDSAEARNSNAAALLDYGFANYSLCPLRPDEPLPPVRVELGKKKEVKTLCGGPEYTVTEKTGGSAEYTVNMEESVAAPVRAGDRLGTLSVRSGDRLLASVPILAGEDVPRIGYLGILGLLGGSIIGL